MARRVQIDEIEKHIADLHGLTQKEVSDVWRSQFALVERTIEEGDFEGVRLPYFGKFYVRAGRVDHINRAVEAANKKNVRKAEDTRGSGSP